MTQFFRRWPFWLEFLTVVVLAFGYFMATSIHTALHPELLFEPHMNGRSLIGLSVIELIVGTVLCLFLWVRGWRPVRVGLRFGWMDIAMGLGLGVLSYLAYIVAFIVFAMLFPDLAARARDLKVVSAGIPLATALVVPWINAIYEELFVAGYIITALKEQRSAQFAINVSVLIRLTYHLYQGPFGVIAVVPLGLIFAYWYAKNGKLWPLIVAHAAIDLIGLLTKVNF